MKSDIKKDYTDFHKKRSSIHLYPTEWVIRTMLGNYPNLKLNRNGYVGGKILDLGFGDGRNFSLLNNCGLKIYGLETTKETCELVEGKFENFDFKPQLVVGSNSEIPFENNSFDYCLASSSCYYVDGSNSFEDNIREISRVIKKGGWLIANFPLFSSDKSIPESFILENCIPTDDGHIIIQNDIYGLRNGYKFKAFKDFEDLEHCLSSKFQSFGFGTTYDNFFGVQINSIIVACQKK